MKLPKISNAEWEIMKVVWERAPRSANDIVEAVEHRKWSPQTVRTLISRLVEKGALAFEKSGREYFYTPKVDRDECTRQAHRSFVRRVYDGAAQPMLANLLEEEDLSPEELESLQQLLEKKRREQR